MRIEIILDNTFDISKPLYRMKAGDKFDISELEYGIIDSIESTGGSPNLARVKYRSFAKKEDIETSAITIRIWNWKKALITLGVLD